ncbi:hypothetical protein B0H14DRAFT_3595084 [Mycena olivaceomarginata]|nr:hypothetical protein B0H14DRAFT_3595084 [Mycena olivaceomarginata]
MVDMATQAVAAYMKVCRWCMVLQNEGVISIYFAEMTLLVFRATFPGVAYQLGNMVSSASVQIEANDFPTAGGEHLKMTIKGVVVPDYGKVQEILISVVAVFVIFITVIGPENHGSHFEKHCAAFDEGGGSDDVCVNRRQRCTPGDGGRWHTIRTWRRPENEKASEERSSTEKPAVTPAWTVLT